MLLLVPTLLPYLSPASRHIIKKKWKDPIKILIVMIYLFVRIWKAKKVRRVAGVFACAIPLGMRGVRRAACGARTNRRLCVNCSYDNVELQLEVDS